MFSTQFAFGSLLAAAVLTAPAGAQLLHKYNFNGTGTVAVDSVGNADGVLLDGATLTDTGQLHLFAQGEYVEFPSGILGTQTSGTFEVWYAWQDVFTPNWPRLMDFGNSSGGPGSQGNGLTYLALTPQSIDSSTPTAAVRFTSSGNSTKALSLAAPPVGSLVQLALVVDSAAMEIRLYQDGVLQDTTPIDLDLSSLVDENNWLGRSQWQNDPGFLGDIEEFRIYGNALTDAEVAASFAAGPDPNFVGDSYCGPSVPNTTGASAAIFGTGSSEVAVNGLTLEAAGLPTFSFAFFIVSQTQGFASQPGGSQGNL
ncbi:MAG: LamG domain-containing protein, partial [Planctomycetota bacterium]